MPDQTTATLRGAAEALELRSAACHYDRHHDGEWVSCAIPACVGDRELVVGLRQLATIRDGHPGAERVSTLIEAGITQQDRDGALRAEAEGGNL